jgi:N-methylhydantoinase A
MLRRVEMRYAGQNYELAVDVPDGDLTAETITELIDCFQHAHDRMYGYSAHEEVVEAVTFRVQAIATAPRADLRRSSSLGRTAADAIVATREVYLPEEGDYSNCPVYHRRLLDVGHRLAGLAIMEQMDATTLLLSSDVCVVDDLRNLVIDIRRSISE